MAQIGYMIAGIATYDGKKVRSSSMPLLVLGGRARRIETFWPPCPAAVCDREQDFGRPGHHLPVGEDFPPQGLRTPHPAHVHRECLATRWQGWAG